MTNYNRVVEMAKDRDLLERIAAAAAEQGQEAPDQWAAYNMWKIAASPGWADSWDYALRAYNVNQNPNTGQRDDVITDQAILAAVQAAGAGPNPAP